MFRTALYALLATASVVSSTQVAFEKPHGGQPIWPSITSFIDDIRRNASIPGISVGVVRLDEDQKAVVQLGSWGRRTEDGDGHDLTSDTLFGLASCSKAFLATSIGLLLDDFAHGRNKTALPATVTRFNYDTKVVDILPEELGWGLHDLNGDKWAMRKASIRDVLGHVSGLPRHDYAYAPGDGPEDVVRRMSSLRTAYELREKWSYNNQMYMLGAQLVSHYAGVSYHEYATNRLLKPLRMSSTTFLPSVAQHSGKLTDCWTRGGRRIPFWFDDDVAELKSGPGGVISSPEDMVKWLAVWLNEGVDPVSGKTIFPSSVYEAVTTAQHIVYGKPNPYGETVVGYGMGWLRWSYREVEIVSHSGGIPGFSLLTAFSPRKKIGVFIASNADEKDKHNLAVLKHILDVVFGLQTPPNIDNSSAQPEESRGFAAPSDIRPLSLGLNAYTGTYSAPGYRPISLCSAASRSNYCSNVVGDFSTLDSPTAVNTSLYSTFQSIWATHVRLTHLSGDVFNITFSALFPQGFGKNTSAFEVYGSGSSAGWVEFAVQDNLVKGFSLVIDEDAFTARRGRTGGKLKEVADAWFTKT